MGGEVHAGMSEAEAGDLIIHPALFRGHPAATAISLLFAIPSEDSPLSGYGIIGLGVIWLICHYTTLTITDKGMTLRAGIFTRKTSEVLHEHIRNIQVSQGIVQQLFGTGRLEISSSGQSGMEISIDGIVDPESIKSIINDRRPEENTPGHATRPGQGRGP